MSLEDELAKLNEYFFYKEFTYSSTQFKRDAGDEVELADSLIVVGRSAIAFQLKERQVESGQTEDTEAAWFDRKVIRKASAQIRDTLGYIQSHEQIELTNHRGHVVGFRGESMEQIHKLIVYSPSKNLPLQCRRVKNYVSTTAGVIHVISSSDYSGIVRTLITPAELMDYLSYRAELLHRWPQESLQVPEISLVGHYLQGNMDEPPSQSHSAFVGALDHALEEWDVSSIVKLFADRITTPGGATEYYPIISAIAELKRNELAKFKERFMLSIEQAKKNEWVKPYRMAVPRTGCGFVFIPIDRDLIPHRREGLRGITLAHKYEQKLSRCIGVTFAPDESGWYTLEWMYIEGPWEHDEEMERLLKENSPFRPVKVGELPRYRFDEGR